MSFSVRDGITPGLARAAAKIKDRKPILEAMGLQLVSITKRAFADESLRAAAWPARKREGATKYKVRDGLKNAGKTKTATNHQLLRLSGALSHSIRIADLSQDHVAVGSDRVYAAIQQLGSRKSSGRGSGIPARPFFPFVGTERLTDLAARKIRDIALRKMRELLKA